MSLGLYVLPDPVGKLLSLLPAYPGSLLFVAGLNFALAKHLPPDMQLALEEKRLRINVTDAQLTFDFQWKNNAFVACNDKQSADLTIGASAHDFVLLAQGRDLKALAVQVFEVFCRSECH